MAKPIPEGYHTVTPYIVVKNGAEAIEFYKRAFGAREIDRMPGPGGQGIMHAEIKIGDSHIMLSDEFPGAGSTSPQTAGTTTCQLFIYSEDVDAAYKKAVDAGATAVMQPADMFWGDRFGKLTDPFGHQWGIATHKEDLSSDEIRKRGEAFFAQMSSQRASQ
jgi:PhnB protein